MEDKEKVRDDIIENEKKIKKDKITNEILEWVFCIVIAVVLAFLIKGFIGTFTTVKQESMYPTLKNDQRLWLDRTIRTFNGKYNRGDIVTFEAPRGSNVYISNTNPKAVYEERQNFLEVINKDFLEVDKISLIKRVIGLPGDHIQIKDGSVYVNGEKLEESYLGSEVVTESFILNDFTVPEGYYFMMGDNRERSSDCRTLGCIPKNKLEGRVVRKSMAFRYIWKN